MDRVKETLFNWLAADLQGAAVLDLFAGSGALGLEALSRGADSATLVESDRRIATHLRGQVDRLGDNGAARCRVVCAPALRWLARNRSRGFDIVFLDPPYATTLANDVMACLDPSINSIVYLETRQALTPSFDGWEFYKSGSAGDTAFGLLRPIH